MQVLKRSLAGGVVELAQTVAAEAPRHSIKRHVEEVPAGNGRVTAKVVFESPAAYVEHGTPAHSIVARGKTLKLQNGRFAHSVKHPGQRADPFINRTFAAVMERSGEIIRAGVAKVGG